jgi:hypothetical protein
VVVFDVLDNLMPVFAQESDLGGERGIFTSILKVKIVSMYDFDITPLFGHGNDEEG